MLLIACKHPLLNRYGYLFVYVKYTSNGAFILGKLDKILKMERLIDTSDTLTLRHELKLNISLTVSALGTDTKPVSVSVSEVSKILSMKCQCMK